MECVLNTVTPWWANIQYNEQIKLFKYYIYTIKALHWFLIFCIMKMFSLRSQKFFSFDFLIELLLNHLLSNL